MSADAKIWLDGEREDATWHATHDGPCLLGQKEHEGSAYELATVIRSVEDCMADGRGMRWEFRVYPDGKAGLRGFVS